MGKDLPSLAGVDKPNDDPALYLRSVDQCGRDGAGVEEREAERRGDLRGSALYPLAALAGCVEVANHHLVFDEWLFQAHDARGALGSEGGRERAARLDVVRV